MRARDIITLGAAVVGLAALAGCKKKVDQPCNCNTEITAERITCLDGSEIIEPTEHEARIYCLNAQCEEITFYMPGNICEKRALSSLRIRPGYCCAADSKNVPPEYHFPLWQGNAEDSLSERAQTQWDFILSETGYIDRFCETDSN
ncbi:MAG: hypothetical protein KJ955_07505 [Nanoarchaeota archaeon]|nr:hypothetical protein [Nanoarchaeota archaeon]